MKLLFEITAADFDAALERIAQGQATPEDENLVRAWLDRAEVRAVRQPGEPGVEVNRPRAAN